MKDWEQLFQELAVDHQMNLDEIPNINLYMDQVIQLFESKYAKTKRKEDEKILTKTMINNYAKGRLLFPIKNKKYTKEHLILLNFIYQMKGVLSITDIKAVLEKINEKIEVDEFDPSDIYNSYLQLTNKYAHHFKENLETIFQLSKKELEKLDDPDSSYLEKLLIISSLAYLSNLYKRAAENLVDELSAD
ncbi:DUF1836 domain-containing protein [Fervidibacillus halotolerans]|uniref:DUF1836 domain-containing protein n=1 Tax=Fervidibacillus halotolerans TaxID=2980027 RepID=A0A9E8M1U5_9BACI|nr:DUF1836 domain-containing protein [Fervidibacillus halotolerans]WAA12729.1 DUF1836 domain-containing protein [Fervidibacillus halotolerans]